MAERQLNNFTQNSTTVHGKQPYSVLETSIAAVSLCLIILLTILGNTTTCYVVFKNKRLWTEMNMFLVNLAIGDLAVGFLSMVFPLVTSIKREWIFSNTICQLNACCNSVLFCSTIFTHTVISIDRYFAIVHPMKKFMTTTKAFLMILAVWIFSVVIVMGPIFGWGHMEYNPTTLQCGYGFPRSKLESLYMVLLVLIAFVIPLITMTVLYVKLYRSLRGHTRRMSTATISGAQRQAALKSQIRVGVTFFMALIAFFICWAPFCSFIAIAAAVKVKTSIPHGLGLAAYWCGFVNSLCNPFIIGLRNEQFKAGFVQIYCCCCRNDSCENCYQKPQVDYDSVRNTKTSSRTTDSETRGTDLTRSNRSSKATSSVDARMIREALDRDAAEQERLPEQKPQTTDPIPARKRKSGFLDNQQPQLPEAYKQCVHIVGNSSYTESGV